MYTARLNKYVKIRLKLSSLNVHTYFTNSKLSKHKIFRIRLIPYIFHCKLTFHLLIFDKFLKEMNKTKRNHMYLQFLNQVFLSRI